MADPTLLADALAAAHRVKQAVRQHDDVVIPQAERQIEALQRVLAALSTVPTSPGQDEILRYLRETVTTTRLMTETTREAVLAIAQYGENLTALFSAVEADIRTRESAATRDTRAWPPLPSTPGTLPH